MRRCLTIVIENDSINNKKWNKIQIEMLQNVQHTADNHRLVFYYQFIHRHLVYRRIKL